MKIVSILVFLILITKINSAQDTWTQKTDFGGTAREDVVGFSIGTKGYFGTGHALAGGTTDFWEWDQATNVWTQKANVGGPLRDAAVGFSIGTKGYIGTGDSANSLNFLKDFWEWDQATNIWTRKADFGGAPRWFAVGFSIGSKGYIGTGATLAGSLNDFWEYDPITNAWTQKANFGVPNRMHAVGFSIGSKGYIGTGGTGTGQGTSNDFWEYNPATNAWSQKANVGGIARESAVGFSISGKGYIGNGGNTGTYFNDFWEYNPMTDSWVQKANFGGVSRMRGSGFSIGNKGYIGMGWKNASPFFFKDFWEYDLCGSGITPSVNIIASPSNSICAGTSVTFTATASNLEGGSVSTYNFKVNGVSQQNTASNIYSTTSLINNDVVTCTITITGGGSCLTSTTALSNTITMVVNTTATPTVSITASPSGAICAGTLVTFTATASNLGGGFVSSYDFKVNGVSQQNTASNTYSTTSLINSDVVTCAITITGGACLTSTTASSNIITMIVNANVTPAVSIVTSPSGAICAGTSVTFTATATSLGGGSVSAYNFKVNGVSQQNNISNTYITTSLVNNDVVTCIITIAGGTCLTSTTASSNTITMIVNATVTPAVSISASPSGAVCAGTPVTFTAIPSNLGGGSVSIYDFKVNGINQQSSATNTYSTASLVNSDVVTCTITITGGVCLTSATASSNIITMVVNASVTPAVSIASSPSGAICAGTSVTFTATASSLGGGSVSAYNFKVNGVSQQNNISNTYITTSLVNNDVVTCTIIIAGGVCLTSTTASSNIITMIVNATVTPTVSISASPSGAICAGTSVTFTATPSNLSGGSVSIYDFKVNSISQQSSASNTYSTTSLVNSDVVTCTITITGSGCLTSTTAISNAIILLVNTNVTPSVTIIASPSGAICAGAFVAFTAVPTNGGTTPSYQWQVNGVNVGTNNPVYTSNTLNNGDLVKCILTSNYVCVTATTATSNTIQMTVNAPIIPSVSIAASATTICTGTLVTFTATPVNGGTTPSYQWKLNGSNVGTNSPAYSTNSLVNSDVISCVLTNLNSCSSTTTAASNNITMIVTTTIVPSLTITSTANNICPDASVTFTAVPVNVGTTPSYQWQVNGTNVGGNNLTYSNNSFTNGDKINCIMNTVTSCSATPLVYSDTITMIVKPKPVISFSPSNPTIPLGSSIQLNALVTGNLASYLWTPSMGLNNPIVLNPIASPVVTTIYNLNVIATNSCSADKQLTVTVFKDIYIPNSFTPNGDGLNDIFRIPPGTSLNLQYFIIYDRYGNEIFKTADVNKGWDGTYKAAKSPNGAYTYLIKGSDSKGEIILNGTVLIIR